MTSRSYPNRVNLGKRANLTAGTAGTQNLFVVGLSYKTAPVEMREKLAVHPSGLRCHGCRLKLAGGLSELVLLSTCNRVEIYGVAPHSDVRLEGLLHLLAREEVDFTGHFFLKRGAEAVDHLFRVTGGLDSMVLGETEISGQVKQAYLAAQEAGLTGRMTNRLFQTALQTAKEIRTRTGIGRGATSVGSVAVELAERIFDKQMAEKTVMIIGAGKMGEACVRHLAKKGARSILVSNRSYDRAVNLASEFGGKAIRFDEYLTAMIDADIVVSSTGCPETILHREEVETILPARRGRPLFLIDIAVPRDIDTAVEQLPGVFLYNVDHLEAIIRENVLLRERELAACEEIMSRRATELLARFQPPREKAVEAAPVPQGLWAMQGAAA